MNRFFLRRNWTKLAAAVAAYYAVNYVVDEFRSTQQRHVLFEEARKLGQQPIAFDKKVKRFHVVLNPRAGEGVARAKFEAEIEPILLLSGVNYDIFETAGLGSAKDHVQEYDMSKADGGLLVVGGDGTLQEVVTGLLRKYSSSELNNIPIGVLPSGIHNLFASLWVKDDRKLKLMRATLAILKNGTTAKASVFQLQSLEKPKPSYALSGIGYGGVSGFVNNKTRITHLFYWDLSLFRIWFSDLQNPLKFGLSYKNSQTGETINKDVETLNFLACRVPKIGKYSVATDEEIAKLNSSSMLVSILGSNHSSSQLLSIATDLDKGVPLTSLPGCESFTTNEIVLTPTSNNNLPFFVDGEDFDAGPIKVSVIPDAITLYTGTL